MLHSNLLIIRDDDGTGRIFNELELKFDRLEVTIRDIIVERVYAEVTLYNKKAEQYRFSLVQPKSDEMMLNQGSKRQNQRANKQPKYIDAEKQVAVALAAFESNGFFILVDDQQAETLDQEVHITAETLINFIKLTPLVGG